MLPTILLVDDNEEILRFLERVLKDKYTVLKAENGMEALKFLEVEPVQIVVSDVVMPVMDGFELCRFIKNTFEYAHIPVVLLMAKNGLQARVQGLELGADAYIEKPFPKELLQAQIASLIANRNIMRAYYAASPLVSLKKNIASSKADERFLERLKQVIYNYIENPELDVEMLAQFLNMSRITLYRKIKAISDLTPIELINTTRLKRAAELLAEGEYKMYEIADMVGFTSQSNFARAFQKQFNMTPTEYMHQQHAEKKKL